MTGFSDKQVKAVFRMIADHARPQMLDLRELIFEVALEIGLSPDQIEETLKWGEPSYLAPKGATVRLGWNEKDPEFVRIFFHCQTSLIETFRTLFPHLGFEGNRAIRLRIADPLEVKPLKTCIKLSLTYHAVKHLPLLGAD